MRWQALPLPEKTTVSLLQQEVGLSSTMASLLAQRGMKTFAAVKDFFRPKWEDLHDPFLMQDMSAAVERINTAIAQEEKIMVFGDYDVDGTTSVALMTSFLLNLTNQVTPYIPDRYKEGYGVSYQGIDHAASLGISLIVALDCGVKAVDKVCLLYTSPSPRDRSLSRMPSSA